MAPVLHHGADDLGMTRDLSADREGQRCRLQPHWAEQHLEGTVPEGSVRAEQTGRGIQPPNPFLLPCWC